MNECEIEWREANGLPVRYCLTHGRDYYNLCGKGNFITGSKLRVTRLAVNGEPVRGVDNVVVETGQTLGFDVRFPETEDWEPKPILLEVSFNEVDPNVLGIMTGGGLNSEPERTFSLDLFTPARRRTFWEWLRRKPKILWLLEPTSRT